MIKQSLSMIFIKNEAKVPKLETNTITVTEVRMSQDLKIAKVYVLPLGGKNAEEVIIVLKKYSFIIRNILSQQVVMKVLPKLLFRKNESLEYAEKLEKLIKQTNNQEKRGMHKKEQELEMNKKKTRNAEERIEQLRTKLENIPTNKKQ